MQQLFWETAIVIIWGTRVALSLMPPPTHTHFFFTCNLHLFIFFNKWQHIYSLTFTWFSHMISFSYYFPPTSQFIFHTFFNHTIHFSTFDLFHTTSLVAHVICLLQIVHLIVITYGSYHLMSDIYLSVVCVLNILNILNFIFSCCSHDYSVTCEKIWSHMMCNNGQYKTKIWTGFLI